MANKPLQTPAARRAHPPTGLRRVAYGCGRVLQMVGLLVVWWALLLASTADMGALLSGVGLAAVVFYVGWACTVWARKGG